MTNFCIIETDDGWIVIDHPASMTAEEAAERHGGVLIDAGPYDDYDQAYDALLAAELELQDDDSGDVPGTRVLEDRSERPE
ncbi:MAG: hypothetical protein WD069_15530 [Planctomycetales bacterium]